MSSETMYYHHGRFDMAGGAIPDAVTAYRTYGDSANPCIVFPTCYGGKLDDQTYMVGTGRALDPEKYYVVTFALFSNGESSSPSNTPAPFDGSHFPIVTYEDNIRAQHRVLTEALSVKRLFCAIGFSMGGQQAYYWAVMYPDFVDRFVCICGSARTSPHNYCFLEGPKIALTASVDFQGGHYFKNPERGIRAFGRVYSSWAYGQSWFRNKGYLKDGTYTDLENWLVSEWETMFWPMWDANDMLFLARTWQMGDVSKLYAHSKVDISTRPAYMKIQDTFGDLDTTLSRVRAKALIMPCKTDLYFPPEDSELEAQAMKNSDASLVVISSDWGHMAGGGSNEPDMTFIADQLDRFFTNL